MISYFRMVPMLLVMGTIFFLSHQPGDELKVSLFSGFDKLAHFVAYAVLACTVIFAQSRQKWFHKTSRLAAFTLIVTILYGVLDEFHQSFIPGRQSSIGDIIADSLGAVAAALLFIYFQKRVKKL